MKYLFTFILLIISLTEVQSFLCQSFNKKTKLFEQYCENIHGIVIRNCSKLAIPIEPCKVQHLKIGACDGNIVWNAIKRYYQIRSLDMSNSGYKTLNWLDAPTFQLNQLQKFNASHNEIEYVWKCLRNTVNMIEIDLSYNKLKILTSVAFGRLTKLLRIYLSHNALKFISHDTFKDFTNLELIDLSDNYFRDLPTFPFNMNLKAIHLERNPIIYFNCPSMALVNRALIYLSWQSILSFYGYESCENHEIHLIPNSNNEMMTASYIHNNELHFNKQSFRKLYSFIAGRNSFVNVTKLLPFLNDLITNLDLSGNYVGCINQSTFEHFDRLIVLSLSDTKLIDFDLLFIRNQNYRLKTLDISNNHLTYIKNVPYFGRFFALNHLNVAGNQLTNIPEILHYLRPTINELNLSDNLIGVLNATTFQRFTVLQTLKLSNTNLTITRINPFRTLQNLQYLDISKNDLESMNFSILSNFSQLSQLNMEFCHINNISNVIYHLKSSIKQLNLAGNIAETFNNQTFQILSHLEFLNISHSNIFNFNFNILNNLSNLQIVDISYNKLQYANMDELPNSLKHLYLDGNDLKTIEYSYRSHLPWLQTMGISYNQLSCLVLRQLISDWRRIQFHQNPLQQKHGKFCKCSAHGMADFLNFVYGKVKFW